MEMRRHRVRNHAVAVMLIGALALLSLAGPASAKLVGDFMHFEFCAYKGTETNRCLYSTTSKGEVDLGSKSVPIVNTVTLQGGITKPDGTGFSKFIPATNGVTLSPTPQPVPGGLLGLVPPEGSPLLIKELVELAAKNGLTNVDTTLEIAGSASKIRVNENHLAEKLGVALEIPVKVHLKNAFLGKSCYVGSDSEPIIWNLTTGATSPPKPNEPISGTAGTVSFPEEGEILRLTGAELVDNAWSAPGPSGCGEALAFLVDPIIEAQLGSTEAGHNGAVLVNTIDETLAEYVRENDELNP